MKAAWARNKTVTTDQILLYNLLRGVDKYRGFTPVTNKVKLANGAAPYYSYTLAKSSLTWKVSKYTLPADLLKYLSAFGPTVTIEIATEAIKGLE